MSKGQLKQWRKSRTAAEKAFRLSSGSSSNPINSGILELKDKINNIPGLEILGSGAYGLVVSTPPAKDGKRTAIKLSTQPRDISKIEFEINSSALAGDVGIGPKILTSNINPISTKSKDSSANSSIEMEYIDPDRHELLRDLHKRRVEGNNTPQDDMQINDAPTYTSAQTAYLAKQGYKVRDRHSGNMFIDKETGLPMQVDFGLGKKLDSEWDRLVEAKSIIEDRLRLNGQSEESEIFGGLVDEHLKSGNMQGASELIDDGIEILSNYLPSQIKGIHLVQPVSSIENGFLGLRLNRQPVISGSPEKILLGDLSSPEWTDALGLFSEDSNRRFKRNPNFVNSEIPF